MFLLFSCLKLWICSSSASRRKLNDHTLLNITDHYGIWWTLAPWSPCSFFHFLPLHSVILDFKVNVFKLFTTFIFLCIINFFLDCFILYCLLVSNLAPSLYLDITSFPRMYLTHPHTLRKLVFFIIPRIHYFIFFILISYLIIGLPCKETKFLKECLLSLLLTFESSTQNNYYLCTQKVGKKYLFN